MERKVRVSRMHPITGIMIFTLLLAFSSTDVLANELPFERDIQVEQWMTIPFSPVEADEESTMDMDGPLDTSVDAFMEMDLVVEDWMTEPFENQGLDSEIEVEDWMTRPFSGPIDEALLNED